MSRSQLPSFAPFRWRRSSAFDNDPIVAQLCILSFAIELHEGTARQGHRLWSSTMLTQYSNVKREPRTIGSPTQILASASPARVRRMYARASSSSRNGWDRNTQSTANSRAAASGSFSRQARTKALVQCLARSNLDRSTLSPDIGIPSAAQVTFRKFRYQPRHFASTTDPTTGT